jgi:hypothetical protein
MVDAWLKSMPHNHGYKLKSADRQTKMNRLAALLVASGPKIIIAEGAHASDSILRVTEGSRIALGEELGFQELGVFLIRREGCRDVVGLIDGHPMPKIARFADPGALEQTRYSDRLADLVLHILGLTPPPRASVEAYFRNEAWGLGSKTKLLFYMFSLLLTENPNNPIPFESFRKFAQD